MKDSLKVRKVIESLGKLPGILKQNGYGKV